MLQFSILGISTRELYLPVRLQKAVIDPLRHKTFCEGLKESKGDYSISHLFNENNLLHPK